MGEHDEYFNFYDVFHSSLQAWRKKPEDAKGRLDLLEKKLERITDSCEKLRILAAIKHSER